MKSAVKILQHNYLQYYNSHLRDQDLFSLHLLYLGRLVRRQQVILVLFGYEAHRLRVSVVSPLVGNAFTWVVTKKQKNWQDQEPHEHTSTLILIFKLAVYLFSIYCLYTLFCDLSVLKTGQ